MTLKATGRLVIRTTSRDLERGRRKVAREQRRAFQKAARPILRKEIARVAPVGATRGARVVSTRGLRGGGIRAYPGKRSRSYAHILTGGRRPGRRGPPPAALTKWLNRKGIPLRAAFVVARSIGRRGMRPRPFYYRGGTAAVRRIKRDGGMRGELRKVARRDLMREARRGR